MNGSIDFTGGQNATARGFVWGATTAYGATTTESDSFDVGSFSTNVTGLSVGTTYHYRAYATNPIGTSYGVDAQFTVYAISSWGSFGSGNGQFNSPRDITVDSSGNTYVLDSNNQRIEKFDASGKYVTQFQTHYSDPNNNFPGPVAVDSLGNVYVGDVTNGHVQVFSSSGTYIRQFANYGSGNGQLGFNFLGIAVDSAGNVYVSDTANSRVEKFNSSGSYVTQWGTVGPGNGQFIGTFGITTDSLGNVYVADQSNHRIQKFDSSGTYITQWGSSGSGNGQFPDAENLTTDSSGNVYVVDHSLNRIQKFTSTGTYITQWGGVFGTGDGQFRNPSGIAIDSSGTVYVADTSNNRIQKFSFSYSTPTVSSVAASSVTQSSVTLNGAIDSTGGKNITTRGFVWGTTTAYGATTTESGSFSNGSFSTNLSSLTVGTTYHYKAYATNPQGTSYGTDAQFTLYIQGSIDEGGQNGVAIDNSGYIYVARSNYTINRLTPSGAYSNIFIQSTYGSADGQFEQITGIAFDSSGNMYVTDSNTEYLQKFDSSGNFITKWGGQGSGDTQFQQPTDLTISKSNGNVYVLDRNTGNGVREFSPSGVFITRWGSLGSGNGQFLYPSGITTDSLGNVYVADNGNNRVQKFDSSGTYITQWGSYGSGNGQFSGPFGITTDSLGNVYVSDYNNSRIEKFDSSGNYITQITGNTGEGKTLLGPTHIAIDNSNTLYVAGYDTLTSRSFQQFSLSYSVPAVDTVSATLMTSINATLNGYVVKDGGHPVTTRGFVWGLTTTYGATTTEVGSFGTQTFSSIISFASPCGTTYHYRAYAINSLGLTYGNDTTFTSPCALYWFSDGSDTDWYSASNWYLDPEHTTPYNDIPGWSDIVIIEGTYTPVVNVDNGLAVSYIDAIPGITFHSDNGGAINGVTITGNVTFTGSVHSDGTVIGTSTFRDTSTNGNCDNGGGTVVGTAIFRDSSSESCGGTITGKAFFHDTSFNEQDLHAPTISFDDSSYNDGSITSLSVMFNGSSYNHYGEIASQSITFNDSSSNMYGSIDNDVTFNNDSYNDGNIAPSAITIFNDRSYNYSWDSAYIPGIAKFMYASSSVMTLSNGMNWGGGNYDDYTMNVGSDGVPITSWIFNGTSENHNYIWGQGTFNDQSINQDCVNVAIFNGDSSEDSSGGCFGQTAIRQYTSDATTTRSFIQNGTWNVIANGAYVDINGASFDGSTIFTTLNGGRFSPVHTDCINPLTGSGLTYLLSATTTATCTIGANGVTLDGEGFALNGNVVGDASTNSSSDGYSFALQNITVNGTVSSNGAFEAGNGGSITIATSTVGAVSANGAGATNRGGNGGTITIWNSLPIASSTPVTAIGGNSDGCEYGGNGGTVTITNSGFDQNTISVAKGTGGNHVWCHSSGIQSTSGSSNVSGVYTSPGSHGGNPGSNPTTPSTPTPTHSQSTGGGSVGPGGIFNVLPPVVPVGKLDLKPLPAFGETTGTKKGDTRFSFIDNVQKFLFAPLSVTTDKAITTYLNSVGITHDQDLVSLRTTPIAIKKDILGLFSVTTSLIPQKTPTGWKTSTAPLTTYLASNKDQPLSQSVTVLPHSTLTVTFTPGTKRTPEGTFNGEQVTFTKSGKSYTTTITVPTTPGTYILKSPGSPLPLTIVVPRPKVATAPVSKPVIPTFFSWLRNIF